MATLSLRILQTYRNNSPSVRSCNRDTRRRAIAPSDTEKIFDDPAGSFVRIISICHGAFSFHAASTLSPLPCLCLLHLPVTFLSLLPSSLSFLSHVPCLYRHLSPSPPSVRHEHQHPIVLAIETQRFSPQLLSLFLHPTAPQGLSTPQVPATQSCSVR
ncbi:hypothetical protein EI94DRAFT_97620 [Lactarius quietus]|nr:hypothetical protein EI94DRAFT_97620 [Lactarius quietus]